MKHSVPHSLSSYTSTPPASSVTCFLIITQHGRTSNASLSISPYPPSSLADKFQLLRFLHFITLWTPTTLSACASFTSLLVYLGTGDNRHRPRGQQSCEHSEVGMWLGGFKEEEESCMWSERRKAMRNEIWEVPGVGWSLTSQVIVRILTSSVTWRATGKPGQRSTLIRLVFLKDHLLPALPCVHVC